MTKIKKDKQTYIYHCRNEECDEMFESKAYGSKMFPDKPKKKCPCCGKRTLDLVLKAPFAYVTGNTGVTVGTFAERRRKELGESECQEREARKEEQKKQFRDLMAQRPLPKGMRRLDKPKEAPWWRPNTKGPDLSLNKLTKEQTEKYILTGEKPPSDRALRVI